MSPVKKRGGNQVDASCQGRKAEPLIHQSIRTFIQSHLTDTKLEDTWTTGVVHKADELVYAASLDAMAILSVPLQANCQQATKVSAFLQGCIDQYDVLNPTRCLIQVEEGKIYCVASVEYKHKSSVKTVAAA